MTITVELAKSGQSWAWDGEAFSLLEFLESKGLAPPFSCRAGICSTCKQTLIRGEVDYFEDPLDPPDAGEVLLCCSTPKTSVVLDM